MKSLNSYINENDGTKKEYTVVVPISGYASIVVEASNEKEAKENALKNTDQLGQNDYWWWFDDDNSNFKVGVIEGYEGCPNEIAYSGCKWEYSKLEKNGWKIV